MPADRPPEGMEEWMRWVNRQLRTQRSHSSSPGMIDTTLAMLPLGQLLDGGTGAPASDVVTADPNSTYTPYVPSNLPPPTPSTPTTTVRLGVVDVCWDGLSSSEQVIQPGIAIEVHRSQEADFAPTTETLYSTLRSPGCVSVSGQAYNSVWYYRLVAVNRIGLRSDPSGTATATTTPLVNTDIIGQVLSGANFLDGTIDTAALADGSISAAKIAAGAIQESHLGFTIETGGGTSATYGADPPASPATGDMWFDANDDWHPHYWNGTAWVSIRDGAIDQARLDAIAAAAADATTKANQAEADAIAAAALTAQQKADLAEAEALAAANSYTDGKVLTAANGKNKIYYATTAPTGGTYLTDDTWFDTDNGYAIARWNGSAWVAAPLGTESIAAGAITETLIGTDAVTTAKIAANAVTAAEIAADTITAAQIAANAITTSEINAGAVTTAKLDALAVTADKIAAGAIIAGKLAADSVVAANIAANQITSAHIAANTITAADIAAGTITSNEIAANTITAADIAALTITAAEIAANAITSTKIAADQILAAHIAAGQINTVHLVAGSVTADIISAGAVGTDELAANSVVAGKIAANAVTAGAIAALAVTAGTIAANAVTADTIAVGAVAASKISTGELAAGVRIIAGPETSSHAEVTSEGFYAYASDQDSGLVREVVRMGTATNDVIAITDASLQTVAAFSEDGFLSSWGANLAPTHEDAAGFPRGVEIYGTDFTDWDRSHGMVVAAGSSTNASVSGITTTVGFRELSFFAETNRAYTVHLQFPSVSDATSPYDGLGLVTLRYTTDGSAPTITSTVLQSAVVKGQGLSSRIVTPAHIAAHGAFGSNQLVRLLACFEAYYPTTHSWNVDTQSGTIFQRHLRMWVVDDGWLGENTMITNTGGGGVAAVKTYVSTWKATGSAAYTAAGGAHYYSPQLVQGYYSSLNGDSYGHAVFGGNAIAGETTKTVATALSGATLLKAEAYLYANHWYYNAGGTAILRPYNSLTLASTVPSGTATTSASWPKPGGRWVTLAGATTAIRGVSVGKAGSTSLTYYGRFNAYNASSGYPLLRLTYKR